MKEQLLIIDPQNDFCHPLGNLYVNGADEDSKRLANFILKRGDKIDKIHVTLDSHNEVDIAHPIFWVGEGNKNPDPFTIITYDDYKKGTWRPSNPACDNVVDNYLKQLEENGRYPLCVWPPHCIIGKTEIKNGTEYCGHAVVEPVASAISEWGKKRFKIPSFVTKGSNPFTEHYSAVKADVPDPSDPSTSMNTNFIYTLEVADRIWITGQALSHCVANTIRDIIEYFGEENAKKFVLLEDTTSNVTGFEKLGNDFVQYLKDLGVEVIKTTDVI